MLRPPTVGHTLGRTVGQPVDLSPLVTFYRSKYPQFSRLTNQQFASAYGLSSVQTTAQELAANKWTESPRGQWNAPMPLCQALRSDTCPMDPNYPSVQVRQRPPQPQPSHRTAPAPQPAPQPARQPAPQPRPVVVRRERTWSDWFWSWFGY